MKRLRPSHSTSTPELRLPNGWQMYAMLPATQRTVTGLHCALPPKISVWRGGGGKVSLTEPRSLHVIQRQWSRLLVQLSNDDGGVGERQVEVQ